MNNNEKAFYVKETFWPHENHIIYKFNSKPYVFWTLTFCWLIQSDVFQCVYRVIIGFFSKLFFFHFKFG